MGGETINNLRKFTFFHWKSVLLYNLCNFCVVYVFNVIDVSAGSHFKTSSIIHTVQLYSRFLRWLHWWLFWQRSQYRPQFPYRALTRDTVYSLQLTEKQCKLLQKCWLNEVRMSVGESLTMMIFHLYAKQVAQSDGLGFLACEDIHVCLYERFVVIVLNFCTILHLESF